MEPGTLCFTVLVGGLGHDQGTRPVLVIGRRSFAEVTGETLVLPMSHAEPRGGYPMTWPVPAGLVPQPSWVLVSRPRAQLAQRLRDPFARLDQAQLEEVLDGLRQLIALPR
jgi:mRNA-degrading endonuclease toxin of MazEF toxin-antitoxin module